jgi:hypothetical protein
MKDFVMGCSDETAGDARFAVRYPILKFTINSFGVTAVLIQKKI